MVVGDDDQSIYRFRGASYAAFAEFDRRFSRPPAHDPQVPAPGPPPRLRIEQNFRSVGNVLEAANRLIGHNAIRLEPDKRLRHALEELYAHYRRTERMRENLLRDEKTVLSVQKTFAAFRTYLDGAADVLMLGRRLRGSAAKRVRAAIGHALAFGTWQSLAREQGLGDAQAAELMYRFVAAAH